MLDRNDNNIDDNIEQIGLFGLLSHLNNQRRQQEQLSQIRKQLEQTEKRRLAELEPPKKIDRDQEQLELSRAKAYAQSIGLPARCPRCKDTMTYGDAHVWKDRGFCRRCEDRFLRPNLMKGVLGGVLGFAGAFFIGYIIAYLVIPQHLDPEILGLCLGVFFGIFGAMLFGGWTYLSSGYTRYKPSK